MSFRHNDVVFKQAWLQKKSKYIGSWRTRWTVIDGQHLFTFKDQSMNGKPTETIQLTKINTVKSSSDTIFVIESDNNYELKADTESDKIEWMNIINKYRHQCIKLPVVIQCNRDNDYNDNFDFVIPFDIDYPYSIHALITDIMQYIQEKHYPFTFIPTRVTSDSFVGQELIYNDYDWEGSATNITDYVKIIIEQIGMRLEIDMNIYQHNITSFDIICEEMKNEDVLCPIYAEMRYQDIFSEKYLNHLYEYKHQDTECKYGDKCYAFKRVVDGGNELKDRCHIMIYRHPPRDRTDRARENELTEEGIKSFCLNDEWAENKGLYYVTTEEKKEMDYNEKDGCLKVLIQEVIDNGYQSDLCLNDDDEKKNNYTLMNVVNEKLNCMRHRRMGSPLNRAEMLCLLLYTGGESNYDLSKSQRNGNYSKWKWFDYCLYNAINKLSKREYGSYKIYTGLSSTKLTDKYIEIGYFKSYVSASWVRDIALGFVDHEGMIFEIDEAFREKAICCDVSWISKFGQTECEILIARSIDAVLNSFECKIIDEINGIQIVSLRLYGDTKSRVNENISVKETQSATNASSVQIAEQDVVGSHVGALNDFLSTDSKLYERMNGITQRQRDIVNMYIINKIKNVLESVIPMNILYLICLFYDYNSNEAVTDYEDGMEVINDKDFTTLKHLKRHCWLTAYGQQILYGHRNDMYYWTVLINALNSKIFIGIEDFTGTVYGFNSFNTKNLYGFGQGDVLLLSYNGSNGILSICRCTQGNMGLWQKVNGINPHHTYRLVVQMLGEGTQVTVYGTDRGLLHKE